MDEDSEADPTSAVMLEQLRKLRDKSKVSRNRQPMVNTIYTIFICVELLGI